MQEGRYVLYRTQSNEIILEPRKSTRPIKYGYYKADAVSALVGEIQKEFNIPIFQIRAYEWDSTKAPGVKQRAEE